MSQNSLLKNIYRINHSQIVNETIDGEVIIINLNKGHYFSLNGVGAKIWSYLKLGTSGNQIISNLKYNYDDSNNLIEPTIKKLLSQLTNEELINAYDANKSTADTSSKESISINSNQKEIFVEPVLEKYTDMEDLLLLDPIHDVDEQGWPKMPEQLK